MTGADGAPPRVALRIAQVAPVARAVRTGTGESVEELVALLTNELVSRGHEVTLYATADSQTSARLRSVHERGYDEHCDLWDWYRVASFHAALAFRSADDHDVIHAHDFHFSLPFAGLTSVPLIETPHVELAPEVVAAYRAQPAVHVAAISDWQRGPLRERSNVSVIPHGIDFGAFPYGDRAGDYLLFLGRMLPDKGPAEAIRIARAAGMRLVLAGPAQDGYDVAADPQVDAEDVRWVGRVDVAERNRLLRNAAALLFPARYPEPFGLVLVEAMACGTPVLATALGAVPEIVQQGVTGFTAPSWEQLVALVPAVLELDRATVRRAAEQRFGIARMVDAYEQLYQSVASPGARG